MKASILFLTLSLWCSSVMATDWPNWLGPNRDGISTEALPPSPRLDQVDWQAEIGIGFSSFAVRDGRVVTMGHVAGEEVVWCFAEATGEVIWTFRYEAGLMPNLHEGGPNATPTIEDGRVYTMSKDGQFHCLSVASGELIWKKNLLDEAVMYRAPEWGFGGSPLILGDWVIVESAITFAYDRKNGDLIWQSERYRPGYGTPQLFPSGGKDYLAILKTDGLVILDPTKGTTLGFHQWRTSFQTNSNTPMVVSDGQIFISTGYDRGCSLFKFDGTTLSQVYENQNMCNHMGNSVLIDGYIYGFDGTAHRGRPVEFACIEAASGEKKWRIENFRYAGLIAARDDLIVLTEDGRMMIGKASTAGFEPVVQRQVGTGRFWTTPVYANGRIFVRNATGKVEVLKVAN